MSRSYKGVWSCRAYVPVPHKQHIANPKRCADCNVGFCTCVPRRKNRFQLSAPLGACAGMGCDDRVIPKFRYAQERKDDGKTCWRDI